MAVEPLARIIRVVLQSVPDMANILALILFFMLVSPSPTPATPFPNGSLGTQGCLEKRRGLWAQIPVIPLTAFICMCCLQGSV